MKSEKSSVAKKSTKKVKDRMKRATKNYKAMEKKLSPYLKKAQIRRVSASETWHLQTNNSTVEDRRSS